MLSNHSFLFFILIMALYNSNTIILFDFNSSCDLTSWFVVNDGVMGGRSHGELNINGDGHAVFRGHVSLDNNGGFTSVRYLFPQKKIDNMKCIIIQLKGDGKSYQVRLKANAKDYYSYRAQIQTSGDWETIKIPLASFSPTFRGRQLDSPNFYYDHLEELGILVGNKKAEDFELIIDQILLSE